MNKVHLTLLIVILLVGCKEKASNKKIIAEEIEFNQNLVNELKMMAELDQIAAYMPQGEHKKLNEDNGTLLKTVFLKQIKGDLNRFLSNTAS